MKSRMWFVPRRRISHSAISTSADDGPVWLLVLQETPKALLLGLLGLLLLANVVVVGELVFPKRDPLVVDTGYDFRTREEFKAASDYHGIPGVVATWNKKKQRWEFQRDGKECPLFAYLEQKGR